MQCERIMQHETFCVGPRASVKNAALLMRHENVGFLPVCDEVGFVLGVVTDRDLAIRACAEGTKATDLIVADVMTREIVACRPADDLGHVEKLMSEHQTSRVLVTDDTLHLVGMISIADIVAHDSDRHAAHTLRKILERELRF